jgi:hypothetical protein
MINLQSKKKAPERTPVLLINFRIRFIQPQFFQLTFDRH